MVWHLFYAVCSMQRATQRRQRYVVFEFKTFEFLKLLCVCVFFFVVAKKKKEDDLVLNGFWV